MSTNNNQCGLELDIVNPFLDVYEQTFTYEEMETRYFEMFPLLNKFTFQATKVIGEQELTNDEEQLVKKGLLKRSDIRHRIKVLIKATIFDFQFLWNLFDDIECLSINGMIVEANEKKPRFDGRVIDHINLDDRNKNFSKDGGVLMDIVHNWPLCFEKKAEITIPKDLDPEGFGLPLIPYDKGINKFFSTYNISQNSSFHERENGQIIADNETIVFLPGDKEIYISNVLSMHDTCLLNHNETESVYVCWDIGGKFNIEALIDSLIRYEKSKFFKQRTKQLVIYLPVGLKKYLLSANGNKVGDYIKAHLTNSDIIFVFADIDEPDCVIE